MTSLVLDDSNLHFAVIDDSEAELVCGGQTAGGGGFTYSLKIDPCGIKICYDLCLPGFKASGDIFIKLKSYPTPI